MKGIFGIVSQSVTVVVLFTACFVEAATFNVTTSAGFQTALTTAQANGEDDTINVAAGTYNVASTLAYSTTQNFDLTITGAGSATTILDGGNSVQVMRLSGDGNGDISVSGITFQHGRMSDIESFGGALFILNTANGNTTVDQCVATNSTAIRNAAGAWLGGVNGTITVTNSSFTHNTCDEGTSDDGCGLYLYFDTEDAVGSAIVRNNNVSNNTLNDNEHPVGGCDGAGMMIYHLGEGNFALTVEDNTFNDNRSIHGVAGIVVRNPHHGATLTITGNTFERNISGGTPYTPHPEIPGGAAHIYSDGGTMIISNNRFIDNESRGPWDRGAGLCVDNFPSGTFRMVSNVFAGNSCAHNGGGAQVNIGAGVTSALIADNLFVENEAGAGSSEGSGGGIAISSSADVTLVNNTFYGNTADDGGGMTYYADVAGDVATLANEIFRANTPNGLVVYGAGPAQATYSNIEGGTGESYFGTGCIDTDPLFFNVANPPGADGIYGTIDDGLHLTAASPSMNTGSNAAVPGTLTLDLAGETRIQGVTVDMGAYEGVAGTPTPYNLTLAVEPEGSGTTNPAVGTHELTSPQTLTATAAAGFVFSNWTTTEGLTAATPNSTTTVLTFTRAGTATANFIEIPATATLTLVVTPDGGGTTDPEAGGHTVNTEEEFEISATAAEGYRFVGWTTSGSVTLASTTQSSTTATLLNNATVTAVFAAVVGSTNLMFIHHSCGQNWLDNSLRAALEAKEYIDEVNEITYGTVVSPDSGRPSSLGETPGELTDINTWLYWFNDYLGAVGTYGCEGGSSNRIVMFKSCFPNSHIAEEGVLPGDPFDSTHTITNHQAVFRNAAGAGTAYTNGGNNYYALEDVFAANPDTLFVYVTAPPECYAEATMTTGDNARTFNDWLKSTWLPGYNAAHPGLNNVQIFDWFDVLANADTGAAYSNMLRSSYGGESGDSHPNDTANQTSTQIYATGTTNFIDLAWARFTSAAVQYAITMASSPVGGGVTVPAVGTANAYAPIVISATAGEGNRFVNWTISANGLVYSAESPVTTLLASGAVTATANFAAVPYMSLGSVATYTTTDLVNFEGTQFGGKPSMRVGYTDPVSGREKRTGLKTAFSTATPTQFSAEWTKKQPLYNKRNIPRDTDSRTYFGENPIVNLICETTVRAMDENRMRGDYSAGQVYVPPPTITVIRNSDDEPITTGTPGQIVYIIGTYFGTKAPQVWFEHDQNGRIKATKCKVQKNLLWNDYLDCKGRPSCMNCETGESMVPVQLPDANKIPDGGFLGFIVLDNGLGRNTYDFTVE